MTNKPSKVPPTLRPQKEEPMGMPVPLELMIHAGQIGVQKIPTPEGTLTVLQIITPMMVFSIKLDDTGVDHLTSELKGSSIIPVPASALTQL